MGIKTNKIGPFCDPHIPWIALLPDMKRFGVECGMEDQSNSALLEKLHFSRFHLKEHGLKQREIKALRYIRCKLDLPYMVWLES